MGAVVVTERSATIALMHCKRDWAVEFEPVRVVGSTLPEVVEVTKYDGSPVLKVAGKFMAGLAMHESAEVGTLVVRAGFEDRDLLIAEAPGTYYITDYYRRYALVLVRIRHLEPDALRELLAISRRLTLGVK
jgi:hypothetical protein